MKPIKFLTAALAVTCIVGAFLPFWNGVGMFEFLTMKSYEAYLIVGGAAIALLLSLLAIQQKVLRRAPALLLLAAFGAIAMIVLINFVPLFDSSPGAFEDLMDNGDIGAKVLFFAGAAGAILSLLGLIKAERAPA